MHSKLMLLSHPGYLRIAVPSANLMPYDWGETGVMENVRRPPISTFVHADGRFAESDGVPYRLATIG